VVTFNRVFRNIYGMTPSKYREQNQETSWQKYENLSLNWLNIR
jgi:AraC-like DNA-binding protein